MSDVDLTARDRDTELKQRRKDYTDSRRNARDSNIVPGNKVLLQQAKENKLSTRYCENPLTVVDKTGSKVTVQIEGRTVCSESCALAEICRWNCCR